MYLKQIGQEILTSMSHIRHRWHDPHARWDQVGSEAPSTTCVAQFPSITFEVWSFDGMIMWCDDTGEHPAKDRLQAAAKLISNHEAVTKFAARGCGEVGARAFTAELSDPYAKPGMQHLGSVDAGALLFFFLFLFMFFSECPAPLMLARQAR